MAQFHCGAWRRGRPASVAPDERYLLLACRLPPYIMMPEPVPVVVCVPASVPMWVPVTPCLALNSLVTGTASLVFCHACRKEGRQGTAVCVERAGIGTQPSLPDTNAHCPACKRDVQGGSHAARNNSIRHDTSTRLVQHSPGLGGVFVRLTRSGCTRQSRHHQLLLLVQQANT